MVFTFQIYCSHKAISSNEIENAHRTEEIKHTISQSISHVRRSHHNWFRKTKQNKTKTLLLIMCVLILYVNGNWSDKMARNSFYIENVVGFLAHAIERRWLKGGNSDELILVFSKRGTKPFPFMLCISTLFLSYFQFMPII